MRLAEPVPKMNAEGGEYEGELHFCSVPEGARGFIARRCAGKALAIADEKSFPLLAPVSRLPQVCSLVFDGDALALFAMPDGASCVLAAGGERTLQAARFFAAVRGVPCALFPSSGSLYGAYERRGAILLGGERTEAAFSDGEVYFDLSAGEREEDGAWFFLSRLARLETRALSAFGVCSGGAEERVCDGLPPDGGRELIMANAALRMEERGGVPAGEGKILADIYEAAGEKRFALRAYRELFALYSAFFEYGRPRRFTVPDYARRAQAAGVAYAEIAVPTRAEFVRRAVALERMRAARVNELRTLSAQQRAFSGAYGGRREYDLFGLKQLPERARGLSALIRDFGLMEEL